MYLIVRVIEHVFSGNYLDRIFSFTLEFLAYFSLGSFFCYEEKV